MEEKGSITWITAVQQVAIQMFCLYFRGVLGTLSVLV